MSTVKKIGTDQLAYGYGTALFNSDGKKTTRLVLNGEREHKTKIAAKTTLVGLTLFLDHLASKVLRTQRKWVRIDLENSTYSNPSSFDRLKNVCLKIVYFIFTWKWTGTDFIPKTREVLLNINSLCKRTSLNRIDILEKSPEELSTLLAKPKSLLWNYGQLNNELFPHVLFINMKDRLDRVKNFEQHLTTIGANLEYQRVDAVVGAELSADEINKMSKSDYATRSESSRFQRMLRYFNPELKIPDDRKGRLGCYMSHLKALKQARDNRWSEVLILEDDVRFIPNYFSGNFARKAKQELPKDWGMCFLGYHEANKHKSKSFSDRLIQPGLPYDCHGYMVNSSMYDHLIGLLEAELKKGAGQMRALDVVIGEEMPKTGKVFCCKENIAIQDEGYSSILGKNTVGNYSRELKKYSSLLSPRQPNATKTADGFPIMPPILAGTLYQMMYHIDRIFKKHGIEYFVESGTALGAERHKGLIPHDDDIDLQIFPGQEDKLKNQDLQKDLKAVGLEVVDHWLGAKICPIVDHPLGQFHKMDGCQFKTPSVDIFFSKEEIRDGEVVHFYKSERCQGLWPHMFIKKSEIFQADGQMGRVPFGPVMVNAIAKQKEYCFRCYGDSCLREAYQQYDHLKERGLEKKPILLTDFAAPAFTQWDGIEKFPEAAGK